MHAVLILLYSKNSRGACPRNCVVAKANAGAKIPLTQAGTLIDVLGKHSDWDPVEQREKSSNEPNSKGIPC